MGELVKDIVIIANFCRDFSETDNGRFMYLCKELSKEHKVEIITSDFRHTAKIHKEPLIHNWPFKITFLHEPGYRRNISVQRFRSHMAWGREVANYLKKRKKPDVIYCAVPSLTGPFAAAKYCEANNIRFIIDIQDLWPEAFSMVFHFPLVSELIYAPIKYIANGIYRRADVICGVSQGYVDRALLVNKKCKSCHAVFLGTDLDTYDRYANTSAPVIYKNREDELWMGYCGSLSASYDIPCVISALEILNNKKIAVPKFVIMGDGNKRAQFEELAKKAGVDAVFLGKLPYDQMCSQLAQCDIVINPIVKGSAASIINKHGDYASAGLPVLNTQESPEYRNLVEDYNMGINCEPGNAGSIARGLAQLIDNAGIRKQMGLKARQCAEERFNRRNSYKELIDCIVS